MSGYIGRTPRHIPASGDMQSVLYFSVGVNRQPGKRDGDGNSTGATDWVDCVVNNKRADSLANLLKQGQGVNVLGAIRSKVRAAQDPQGRADQPHDHTALMVEGINVFHYGKDSTSASAEGEFEPATAGPVEQFQPRPRTRNAELRQGAPAEFRPRPRRGRRPTQPGGGFLLGQRAEIARQNAR